MEKYTVSMDQKNQYSENEYTIQSDLQIQCNPIKLPMVFFTKLENQNLKRHMYPNVHRSTVYNTQDMETT